MAFQGILAGHQTSNSDFGSIDRLTTRLQSHPLAGIDRYSGLREVYISKFKFKSKFKSKFLFLFLFKFNEKSQTRRDETRRDDTTRHVRIIVALAFALAFASRT